MLLEAMLEFGQVFSPESGWSYVPRTDTVIPILQVKKPKHRNK